MEALAHAVQAAIGAHQHRFGGVEIFPGLQAPIAGVQPGHQAHMIPRILVDFHHKAAGPYQAYAPYLALTLIRCGGEQGQEGIVFVAGCATVGAQGEGGMGDGQPFGLTLPAPGTVQVQQLPFPGQVQRAGKGTLQQQGFAACIVEMHGAGQRVEGLQNRIAQGDLQASLGVAQIDFEGGCLILCFNIDGGQTGQQGLSGIDGVTGIGQHRAAGAVRLPDGAGGGAEVSPARGGVGIGSQLMVTVKGCAGGEPLRYAGNRGFRQRCAQVNFL